MDSRQCENVEILCWCFLYSGDRRILLSKCGMLGKLKAGTWWQSPVPDEVLTTLCDIAQSSFLAGGDGIEVTVLPPQGKERAIPFLTEWLVTIEPKGWGGAMAYMVVAWDM